MLNGTSLSKWLNGNQALSDVDISITSGQATVVVGPNGAGKSVLIRALAMVDPPDAGSVTVDQEIYRFPHTGSLAPNPWPNVTVCFQQLFLWPHLTLRRSVLLPLQNRRHREAAADRITQLAGELGISGLLDRYPNECSLGERQRAALLRALVLEPRYLLCDEATAALDVEATFAVLELFTRELQRGMGLLMVTHQLGFAARLANKVVFLEGGRIKEEGGPQILATPTTDRMRRFVEIMES